MDPEHPYYMILQGIDSTVGTLHGTVDGFSSDWATQLSSYMTGAIVVGCVVVLLLIALVVMEARR